MPVYKVQSDRELEEFVGSLKRRLLYSVAALVGIVVTATVGFVVFGEERYGDDPLSQRILYAFWDTLQLVSTVGSIREDFTWDQRLWAILVIIFGLGAVLTAFSTIMGLVQGGDVRRHFARNRMYRTLTALNDHIVLCGYGHVGREVARQITKAGRELVVIDRKPEAVEEADAADFLVVQSDATDEQTLRDAGVDRAAGLIATLDSDAANVYLILIARELKPGLRIVARADRDTSRSTLLRAGADRIIVPGEIAGLQLSHLILKPRVSEFITAATGEGEYDFVEIDVVDYPFLQGKTLRELNLPVRVQVIVIAIIDEDGNEQFNPSADRVLEPSDILIAVTHETGLKQLSELK